MVYSACCHNFPGPDFEYGTAFNNGMGHFRFYGWYFRENIIARECVCVYVCVCEEQHRWTRPTKAKHGSAQGSRHRSKKKKKKKNVTRPTDRLQLHVIHAHWERQLPARQARKAKHFKCERSNARNYR